MNKIYLILFSIVGVLFISGCTSNISPSDIAKATNSVKEFLDEYPNAKMTASLIDESYIESIIDDLRNDCGEQMMPVAYWKVLVKDPDSNSNVTVWIKEDGMKAVCVIREGEEGTRTYTGRIPTGFTTLGSPEDWNLDSDGKFSIIIKNSLAAGIEIYTVTVTMGSNTDTWNTFNYNGADTYLQISPSSMYSALAATTGLDLGSPTLGISYSVDVSILYNVGGGLNHTETGTVTGIVSAIEDDFGSTDETGAITGAIIVDYCLGAGVIIQGATYDDGTLSLYINNWGDVDLTFDVLLTFDDGLIFKYTDYATDAGELATFTIGNVPNTLTEARIQSKECKGVQDFIGRSWINGLHAPGIYAGSDALSAEEVGDQVLEHLNTYLLMPGYGAELVSTEEANGMVKVDVKVTVSGQSQDVIFYASNDGRYLFLSPPADMDNPPEAEPDKPSVPATGDYPKYASSGALSVEEVGNKVLEQLNFYLLKPGYEAEVTSAEETSGMVEVGVKITADGQEQEVVFFASNDGKYLFLSPPADMENPPEPQPDEPADEEYPKTDIPNVKMFVMSFCPFGQQAENGLGSALETIGEYVDFEPHFVLYDSYGDNGPNYCIEDDSGRYCSMHGINELNEDIRQAIVWKYYPDKWWDYVNKINADCSSSNVETCWKGAAEAAGLDVADIEAKFGAEKFGLVAAEYALNVQYGVRGSPSIFINDVKYAGTRSLESFKSEMCSAFNTPPEECDQKNGKLCEDKCGDGVCQTIVCMSVGCPCAETPESCPEDCVLNALQ